MTTTTRRELLQLMAVGSGALVFGVRFAFASEDTEKFVPNAWLRIEADGSIVVTVGKSELGQGVRTSLPMILAEELDADFSRVVLEQAEPGPDFRRLGTGGSGSIMGSWDPLRQAGAAARTMLVAAAAARWGVAPDTCTTESSRVVHRATKRSLAYGDLAAEAAKMPVPENPKLKDPADFTLIGTSQRRLDGPDIVTGRATYGFDVRLPGMRHAVVARSPILGGSVASYDASAAKKVAGVRDVVRIPSGIAVVADSTWAAIRGREALEITWNEGPHAGFSGAKLLEELDRLAQEPGVTIRKDGRGRPGIGNAETTFEATYHYPWEAHASVEPVNCTAVVREKSCELWTPTQTPNRVHTMASQLLDLPESAVTVHVVLAGGGFGRRLDADFDREAVEIARQLPGTPIHLYWTREDDMRHGYFQAPSVHRLSAGLDGGKVVAWEHRKVSIPHNARGSVPSLEELGQPSTAIGYAWGVYDTPYGWPDAEMTYRGVHAPTPIGPWRSVFSPSSVFARECFVDEVAEALGRDAVALRLEMLGAGDPGMPATFEIDGELVDRTRMRRVIELVREKCGWGGKPVAGRAWGFAASYFHTGTYIAHAAEVSLRKDARRGELPFRVHRVVCGVDCGIAINPDGVAQQVESGVLWSLSNMKGEITFENGRVVEGNYDDFLVATIEDTPPVIETHLVQGDAARPHGLGEPVVDTVAPAVANAVSKLAGKRIRKLPVAREDLG